MVGNKLIENNSLKGGPDVMTSDSVQPQSGLQLDHLRLEMVEWMPVSARSKDLLTSIGRDFNQYLKQRQLALNWLHIKQYLEYGSDPHRAMPKANTFNNKKYAIKKLLLAQEEVKTQPLLKVAIEEHFRSLKSAKVDLKVHDEDYLKLDEVNELVEFCMRGKNRQIKIGIVIQALFETGCRVSELIHIRKDDCVLKQKRMESVSAKSESKEFESKGESESSGSEIKDESDSEFDSRSHYRIRVQGKGKKERYVYLKSKTYDRAVTFFKGQTFLFESENGTMLFRNNVFRSIQRMGKKSGLDKPIHPHTLRHSCAMHLLKDRELNAKAVSEYLGHSDVSITLKSYIHDMPNAEDVFGEGF
jgi:integrase/recombinase XerD